MNEGFSMTLRLFLIGLIAAMVLAGVELLTAEPILEQERIASQNARMAVMPSADDFSELPVNEDETVKEAFEALASGQCIGHVLKMRVRGYGGVIELIAGYDTAGLVTGINMLSHSETPGFGAKTADISYLQRYFGKQTPVTLGTDIQAITGATISSRAVTNAVNSGGIWLQENVQ